MLTPPKIWHLETLNQGDLPHLIERRQAVYRAMNMQVDEEGNTLLDAAELARLFEMMFWLTEQIVYLRSRR